jgi:hypothetical protein
MSIPLSFTNNTSELGSIDGEVVMNQAIKLNPNTKKMIRLDQLTMTSQLPNIYNFNGVNTGLLRTSKDDGVSWDIIQLNDGIYTVSLIQAAILSVITSYWTDSNDPGFAIRYNTATQIVYIEIDSSKLAVVDQFQIDIAPTGSSMNELLGFSSTTLFDTDGLHDADLYAQLDWFGNNVSVQLEGFGSISFLNGQQSNQLCSVPLSSSIVNNEYVFPTAGIISPWILIRAENQISKYSIKLVGSSGRNMIFLQGSISLSLELREI